MVSDLRFWNGLVRQKDAHFFYTYSKSMVHLNKKFAILCAGNSRLLNCEARTVAPAFPGDRGAVLTDLMGSASDRLDLTDSLQLQCASVHEAPGSVSDRSPLPVPSSFSPASPRTGILDLRQSVHCSDARSLPTSPCSLRRSSRSDCDSWPDSSPGILNVAFSQQLSYNSLDLDSSSASGSQDEAADLLADPLQSCFSSSSESTSAQGSLFDNTMAADQPVPRENRLPFGAFIPVIKQDDVRLTASIINLSSVALSVDQAHALNLSIKFR